MTSLAPEENRTMTDTERLGALEKAGRAYQRDSSFSSDIVQIEMNGRRYEWSVTGIKCTDGFGNQVGRGKTLREAIDDALTPRPIQKLRRPR